MSLLKDSYFIVRVHVILISSFLPFFSCVHVLLIQLLLFYGMLYSISGMPLAPGSSANDILFFMAGIVARKDGWLEQDLKRQIAMPIILLRCMVVVEAVMMIMFFHKGEEEPLYFIPALIISGVHYVDASLIALDFFQTNMDIEN